MKKSIDEIKKIYESFPADIDTISVERGRRSQRAWHAEKLDATIAAIESANLEKGAKIADVACGSGPLTLRLAKKFKNYNFFGCDFNSKAIRIAKKNAKIAGLKNVSFFNATAEKLPFEKNFFDAVIALDALDHFFVPKKALEEMYRVSKSNALLALAVGNYYSLWPIVEFVWDKFGWGRNYLETHLTHFNTKTLEVMVKGAGYKELQIMTLHNSRPVLRLVTYAYSKRIEDFLSKHNLGMTLFLTAKK